MLDKRITMKPDRGLVKYVKIKRKRDKTLENDFIALVEDQKKEIDKNITLTQQVQNCRESLLVLQKVLAELTTRKKQNIIRITDAKDKLAVESQKFDGAKTEKDRKVSDARQEVFARAQAKSEIEAEEIEKAIKETNETITLASDTLNKKQTKLEESNARASELLALQTTLQAAGKKLADEDFADITQVMEDLRKTEKYKQIQIISQTDTEYIFLLVQPEEYVGDPVQVTVKPVEPEAPAPQGPVAPAPNHER